MRNHIKEREWGRGGLAGAPIGEAAGVFTEIFLRTAGEGARQVHLNGGATNGEYVVGVGWELHL